MRQTKYRISLLQRASCAGPNGNKQVNENTNAVQYGRKSGIYAFPGTKAKAVAFKKSDDSLRENSCMPMQNKTIIGKMNE